MNTRVRTTALWLADLALAVYALTRLGGWR